MLKPTVTTGTQLSAGHIYYVPVVPVVLVVFSVLVKGPKTVFVFSFPGIRSGTSRSPGRTLPCIPRQSRCRCHRGRNRGRNTRGQWRWGRGKRQETLCCQGLTDDFNLHLESVNTSVRFHMQFHAQFASSILTQQQLQQSFYTY
jgi:hypothetical protein